ncbi:hypothetical protein IFM89_015519 [Coptis chinensis]|uniref:GH10 domain-containing protein n=1 Tax=Coptis chinensis TaxID=261450 RepID=A0A835IYB9_9MAGN|nr:hypothetical protein IFM89_015519 [Coptis chinensis]
MLKGGLTVDSSGPAELYFESNNTRVEIWADNVSLQPFTKEQWRSHQDQSIEKARKGKVKIQAVDSQGKILAGAKVSIRQNSASFPFGSAITKDILTNQAYQNWFTSRFTVTVFENEMKWYSTENTRGKDDYSVSDAMVKFAQQHDIAVRGHNIFWGDERYQPCFGLLTSLFDYDTMPVDALQEAFQLPEYPLFNHQAMHTSDSPISAEPSTKARFSNSPVYHGLAQKSYFRDMTLALAMSYHNGVSHISLDREINNREVDPSD